MAEKPVVWLGSALEFAEAVFVIHAFQKKTRKTAKHDIDLAKHRLAELIRRRSKR